MNYSPDHRSFEFFGREKFLGEMYHRAMMKELLTEAKWLHGCSDYGYPASTLPF
jgi:hypothetical protein